MVDRYKKSFDCEAVAEEFSATSFRGKKFDLIIARDLIEHLTDPATFFHDVNASLIAGGYFFFITPNGREDLWESSQRYLARDEASVLYQNHYHFYLPETLDRLLDGSGLEKSVSFKWGLKWHRKGFGHRQMTDFEPVRLPDTSLLANKELLAEYTEHDKSDVFNSILHGNGLISRLYSRIVDRPKGRVDYHDFKGHEFFVLARKVREITR